MSSESLISYVDAARGWLLQAGDTSYAFAVSANGFHLKHLYWGPRITARDVVDLAAPARDWWLNTPDTRVMREPGALWRGFESAPRAFVEEFVAQGAFRFDEPTLVAETDSNSDVLLEYQDYSIRPTDAGSELEIALTDSALGLSVGLHYRVRHGLAALERWTTIANTGSSEVRVSRLCSASWALPWGLDLRVRSFFGHVQGEFQLDDAPLPRGRRSLGSRTGTSGHRGTPWIALHEDASEVSGDVWSVGLSYSGSWQLTTQLSDDAGVHIVAGVADEELREVLLTGASLTTPVSVGVFTDRGFAALSHQWHAHVNDRLPAPVRPLPVMYNSWFALQFQLDEESLLMQARRAAGMGVELFVIDDGWFAGRDDDFGGLGRWTPDTAKFPRGLAPVREELAELGMELGVWVEPEMCTPDSEVFQRHPEWLHGEPGRSFQTHRNQYVIDLGIADARKWVVSQVSQVVHDSGCSYVVWDMNRPIPLGRATRRAANHLRHADGLALVIDELRERHPRVTWQACSGGGGRADLGILTAMSLTWPSDDTDARDRARIVQSASYVLPPSVLVHWITDPPSLNATTDRLQRTEDLSTRFHTAINGVLGISADLTAWSADELAVAAEHVDVYKRARSVIADGAVYRLTVPPRSLGLAYVSTDLSRAFVVVVADRPAFGETTLRVRLAGLDPSARYAIDGADPRSGRLLMTEGLTLVADAGCSWALSLNRVTD